MEIIIRKPLSFSRIGQKDNQEDCIYPAANKATTKNRFFILCDGMGGHEYGEVASKTVCQALSDFLNNHQPSQGIMTVELFNAALKHAYDELDKKDTGATLKMGTTMTCLYLHRKGYLVAHIGDSRIYHIRPSLTDLENERLGILYQSSDHSLVNDLLRAGELTEEEALHFPQKNIITRVMQPHLERRYNADIYSFNNIQRGDYFFLCSDGILEQLTNEHLCEILSEDTLSDKEKLDAIKHVCDGKTKDNYTCYLIPIDDVIWEEGDDEHNQLGNVIQAKKDEGNIAPASALNLKNILEYGKKCLDKSKAVMRAVKNRIHHRQTYSFEDDKQLKFNKRQKHYKN